MTSQPREVERYVTPNGRIPFDEWLYSLQDAKVQTKVSGRLERVKLGNLGDYRSVGQGVCELRIDCGPGYRVYFGQIGSAVVLLLCGGDKSTQDRDIRQAIEYWTNYRS